MRINRRQTKKWQKGGLIGFAVLYILLGIGFCLRGAALSGNEGIVAAWGRNIGIWEERTDNAEGTLDYKEIKKVAITFDDGPHPVITNEILDGLKEREVKATFFITGEHAEEYPDIVRRIYGEGHMIGNHTYSHIQLTPNNKHLFAEELRETSRVIAEITGQETIFVRPPYGEWNRELERELNMFPVLWTLDPLDWCQSDASCVVDAVMRKVKADDIILFHDEYESTKIAVLEIVDRLLADGYEFVTVDEILFN